MEKPLTKFGQLSPGDCFGLKPSDGYRYLRVDDLYDPYMQVRINTINLDTGFGKYFFKETKIEELTIDIKQPRGRQRYKIQKEDKNKNGI